MGADFLEYDDEAKAEKKTPFQKEEPKEEATKQAEPPKKEEPKKDTQKPQVKKPEQPPKQETPKPQKSEHMAVNFQGGSREQRREPMNRMRQRIAQRLKESQNTNATLTTFNEVDMSEVMAVRSKYQEEFVKKHGLKLGLNSFFLRASTIALMEMPIVNAVIDGNDILYRDYVDISVAVATPNGLMVPVIRNCETMNFSDFEKTLRHLSLMAKENKIKIEDMVGGNFSVSNGGVYGSMLGTPIINPPQTAILGLHNITNRAVVRGDEIVARPMM